MLTNSKGFIWVETLIAMTVFISLCTFVLPIYSTIQQHQTIISERSLIGQHLYNELQKQLHEDRNPTYTSTETLVNRTVRIAFSLDGKFVKGCATWTNVKNKQEKLCLYGLSP